MTGEQVMVPEACRHRWSIIALLLLATSFGALLTAPSIASHLKSTGFDWRESARVED
jgi:hypothetical protein